MRGALRSVLAVSVACAALACSSPQSDPAESTAPPADPVAWLEQLSGTQGGKAKVGVETRANGFALSAPQGQLRLSFEQGARHLTLKSGTGELIIIRDGAVPAKYSLSGTTLFESEGAPGIRAAFFARVDGVEELVHVADRRTLVGYTFEHPRGISLRVAKATPTTLEIADAQGKSLARVSFPMAFDSVGRTWQVELRVEGSSARLLLPQDATYPIVIDPLWTQTGIPQSRLKHTATAMLDGTVLLVGGAIELTGGVRDSAEIYEPQRAAFKAVGSLAEGRQSHSATLLRDGRVLVAGGFGEFEDGADDKPGRALASVEIYDPETREFESCGTLNHARGLHTATLLPDDRVLIVGGSTELAKGSVVPDFEVCLPNEQRCDELGWSKLITPGHAAVLRKDGHVDFLSPGKSEQDPQPPSFAKFDPSKNGIDPGLAFPSEVLPPYATSELMRLVPGTEDLEFFTPGSHVILDDETHVVLAYAAQALTDGVTLGTWQGRGLAVGGSSEFRTRPTTFVERDPHAAWAEGPFLVAGRDGATVTALPDGSVLAAGGLVGLVPAEVLAPDWRDTEPVMGLDEVAGTGHAATLLDDGRLLFTGGLATPTSSRRVRFSVPTEPTEPIRADSEPLHQLRARRGLHQALLMSGDEVLIAGGKTEPEDAHEELLDLRTGNPKDLGLRLHDRGAGLYLGGSRLLFAGSRGIELLEGPDWHERKVELDDEPGCDAPGVVRLVSGHVLVLGLRSLFEVDVMSASVVKTVPQLPPRCDAAAAVMQDGTVFIAGGNNAADDRNAGTWASRPGKAAARYDPSTGVLSPLTDLLFAIEHPAAFTDGFQHITVASSGPVISGTQYCDGAPAAFTCVPGDDATNGVNFGPGTASYTRLSFGGVLSASGGDPASADYRGSLWLRTQPAREGLPADAPAAALQVEQGATVELSVAFSTTWPEQSGGVSGGSAANAPVPIWVPAVGGCPALGTFERWSEHAATWRVPHTPFPGLGTLFFSVGGVQHPLRMVRIAALAAGEACHDGGECGTGYCTLLPVTGDEQDGVAEGVCCDSPCDGGCQACTAKRKGYGSDGVCEPLQEGAPDDACGLNDLKNCGHSGKCDGAGQCETYAVGAPCGDDGAVCNAQGFCRQEMASCEDDHTSKNGAGLAVDCARYRCASSTGECLHQCTSNADCTGDNVCEVSKKSLEGQGTCEGPLPSRRTSVGCAPGCRLAESGSEQRTALWSSLAALALLCWRRVRRDWRN